MWTFVTVLLVVSTVVTAYDGLEDELDIGNIDDLIPEQQLLVIMLDGFRWDYFEKLQGELPGFEEMFEEGVKAEWVEPVFPTVSYPAWTTLSTGLYTENHNIVGNYFVGSNNRRQFALFNATTTGYRDWWIDAEPIWVTAKKHNKKVATHYWSRSDVQIGDIRLDTATGFTSSIKGINQARSVFRKSLQSLLEDGCHLVMSYVEHIDNVGHEFGPDSQEILQAIKEIDEEIVTLRNEVKKRGLTDRINIMIVSDHGMASVGPGSGTTVVQLSDYVDIRSDIQLVLDRGAFIAIRPYATRRESTYISLAHMPGAYVYRKQDIPSRYHYARSRQVQEILIVAREGYYIQGLEKNERQIPRIKTRHIPAGAHGYDPDVPDMRAIFVAVGPKFARNHIHDPIHMVDIYQMYGHVLDIPYLPPHNGSWNMVSGMFNSAPITSVSQFLSVLFFSAAVVLLTSR